MAKRSVRFAGTLPAANVQLRRAKQLEDFASRFGASERPGGLTTSRYLPASEPSAPTAESRKPAEMVLLARQDTSAAPTRHQASGDTSTSSAQASESSPAQPHIDPQVIADKVYKIMRHDLLLERERVGKRGITR